MGNDLLEYRGELPPVAGGDRYRHLLSNYFRGDHPYNRVEKVVGDWNLVTLPHHRGHIKLALADFVDPDRIESEYNAFFEWVAATPPKVVPVNRKFFRSSGRPSDRGKANQVAPLKLTILIREDLSFGRQLAQVAHMAHQWAVDHPSDFSGWFQGSNTLIVRSVPDERTLRSELDRLRTLKHTVVSSFVEPGYSDMPNTLTSIAIGPSGYREVSHFPLASGKKLICRVTVHSRRVDPSRRRSYTLAG